MPTGQKTSEDLIRVNTTFGFEEETDQFGVDQVSETILLGRIFGDSILDPLNWYLCFVRDERIQFTHRNLCD